ncbi:MAG: DNA polymerase III subunit delta' [Rhodospirillales bacterium]|nr:DNA polymerase III subunit delta' [Rhodospirillales bacterium]
MSGLSPEPRANATMVGQAAAERAFLDAWGSGRLAHAWLLTGPRGIGKATMAYRIARFVLSGGGGGGGLFGGPPDSLAVANDHPIFQRVASGGHADLKIIEKGVNDEGKPRMEIPVDAIRELGSFMNLTPAEGGWRLAVVDAADEMNRSSANAILKILEEPPARALLLLVCHAPGRLLPTIRSRCRRLALKPLAEKTVADLLAQYRPDLPADEAAALARLAEGSIGRALALAEEGGLDLYREMVQLLISMPQIDVQSLQAFGDRLARTDGAERFRTLAELMGGWLARMIAQAGRGGAFSEVVAGEGELMRRLTAARGLDRWVELWEKSTALFARAEAVHLDRKQVILNAFLAAERLLAA